MRIKLARNIGTQLLKELGLFNEEGPNIADFRENAVVEVDDKAAKKLKELKLAADTSDPVGPPPEPLLMQGVPPFAPLQAVPPTPATFNQLQPTAKADPVPQGTEGAEDAIKEAKKR
jgi:hypothetical protein